MGWVIRTLVAGLALGCLSVSAPVQAQAPSAQRVAFEAASVRVGERRPMTRTVTDTRLDLGSATIRDLMLMAYQIEFFRLVLPAWVGEQQMLRFDVHATLPAGATREQIPAMMRTLLVERFGLKAHFEPRPTDVSELTVAESGLRVRAVEPKDDRDTSYPVAFGNPAYDRRAGPSGQTRLIQTPDQALRIITARTNYERRSTDRGTIVYDATRVSMAELVDMLSSGVGKPVIDKTGLTGLYQFRLELPQNPTIAARVPAGLTTNRNGEPITIRPISSEPSAGSAYKAVEALGLKLNDRRLPFDMLVVDSLSKEPTPN